MVSVANVVAVVCTGHGSLGLLLTSDMSQVSRCRISCRNWGLCTCVWLSNHNCRVVAVVQVPLLRQKQDFLNVPLTKTRHFLNRSGKG